VIPFENRGQGHRVNRPTQVASSSKTTQREVLRFGGCRLDRTLGLLHVDGQEVWLPPKASAVLDYLVDRPGAVIHRHELVEAVWSDTVVTDHSLTEVIRVLRSALGDDPRGPRYVQTIHKRGYRWVAEVRLAKEP